MRSLTVSVQTARHIWRQIKREALPLTESTATQADTHRVHHRFGRIYKRDVFLWYLIT